MGVRHKNKAQATMELALAMIGVVILFLGCINTFVWISKRLTHRQRSYDTSRVYAASAPMNSTPDERQVHEEWLPKLDTLE